jgi:hypothetical protein
MSASARDALAPGELRRGGIAGRAALDGESLAWLLAAAGGLLLPVAIVLVAPSLGRALFPPLDLRRVWPGTVVRPEAGEQAAYLLALVAAAALPLAIVALRDRVQRRAGVRVPALAVPLARVALVGLALVCVVAQYRMRYGPQEGSVTARYFTPATWIAAGAIAAALALALRSEPARLRIARLLRERRATSALAAAVAIAVTAAVLLASVDTDATIAAHEGVRTIVSYVMEEAFAVRNGLSPFVDFQPAYASLWPYVEALPLAVFGRTLLVFTLTLYALDVAALVAVYGVLRRVTRSALGALGLYLPFLATTLFLMEGTTLRNAYSSGSYYPMFPLRYAGPYLLAWLTVATLGTRRRWARPALFAAAGLVVLNNSNFGLPALGGTIAALLCASELPPRRAHLLALARDVALGLAAAVAAVCALTLAHSGSLPDLTQLFDYASYFLGGFSATPIPSALGLHVLLYVTFAGALGAAAVRALRGAANRALTAMLAWSGVFGLGAGSYFVAESGPFQMRTVFSAWALALALLVALVVGRLWRARRRPDLAEALVLIGLGVMVCSLPQLSRPWTQLGRLRNPPALEAAVGPFQPDLAQRDWLASMPDGRHELYVKRGAPIALLLPDGHRTADAIGVVDVSPYTDLLTVFGPEFVRRIVADLRRAGGNTIVLGTGTGEAQAIAGMLARSGFGVLTDRGVERTHAGVAPATAVVNGIPTAKWIDLGALHPRALRGARGRLVASYPPRR